MTVDEYQEMLKSGKIRSGIVDLLPPLNAPITPGVYRRRDGGTVRIVGPSVDPKFLYTNNGLWYEVATGRVKDESQFYGVTERIGD